MDELLGVLTPYVRRICGPVARQDSADAAQDTLVAVLRNLRRLREPAALLGWVRVIAVREAVRHAERRPVTVELAERPAPGDPELAADIDAVLRGLPPDQRAVLTLRHVEGLSEQEAAAVLAVPVGTVRSRLFRARRAFRRARE
ncbi:RNA polymerase sigma factor [Streptomyces sp. A3M-1-3]|nr:RNA polymerase sigma factor [Streptomyces sp. A3M-1-3]MCP3818354.1 RNA polymerase sigma factor [Streptomyces sp. A3M-1-3]